MSKNKGKTPRKRWSILAVFSFLLAVAAALATFFWQTIWRSPFQRYAEPRYVIGAALTAMIISGVVGFVFKPQKKRGVWLAWIALALSFGTLVSFNLMTGDMLKQTQSTPRADRQNAPEEPSPPEKQPPESEKVVEPVTPGPNVPPATTESPATEPNTTTAPITEPNEPRTAEPNAPAGPVVKINDSQFSGFAELVEDVRHRQFDAVYQTFTDQLKQQWPRDAFIADMNSFRDEIGDNWHLRPGGFSGGYDEKGAYFLCAVVLTDSNDYQIFAELAADDDAFEVNRLTPMRLKMADEQLVERIRNTATRFVATLMSGDYGTALRMIRPRADDEPTPEELARIRRTIRGGTFNTPQFVFSSVDWMIESGRNEYGIEAMPLNSTGTQLRMVLYEPNAPGLALDFIQFREPVKDPNQ